MATSIYSEMPKILTLEEQIEAKKEWVKDNVRIINKDDVLRKLDNNPFIELKPYYVFQLLYDVLDNVLGFETDRCRYHQVPYDDFYWLLEDGEEPDISKFKRSQKFAG